MTPARRPLPVLDEVTSFVRPTDPSHRGLSASLALLHEMAATLDDLGSPEMARALRAEASALFDDRPERGRSGARGEGSPPGDAGAAHTSPLA
jgi:hypothetical protein